MASRSSGSWQNTVRQLPMVLAGCPFSVTERLSRTSSTPVSYTHLDVYKRQGELQLKRRKKSRILALLFGTEGELAGNALKAQKKSLRTATLSLTLSFLGFALMLSFFSLSGISTNHTYFERYQDAWDVMATLEDTKIEDFSHTEEIHALTDTCLLYTSL